MSVVDGGLGGDDGLGDDNGMAAPVLDSTVVSLIEAVGKMKNAWDDDHAVHLIHRPHSNPGTMYDETAGACHTHPQSMRIHSEKREA